MIKMHTFPAARKKNTLLIHSLVTAPSVLRLSTYLPCCSQKSTHFLRTAVLLTLQCYVLYLSYMAWFLLPQCYMVSFWLFFFLFASLASMQHWRARIKPVSRVRMRVLFSEQRCLLLKYNLLTRKVVSNIPLFARQ